MAAPIGTACIADGERITVTGTIVDIIGIRAIAGTGAAVAAVIAKRKRPAPSVPNTMDRATLEQFLAQAEKHVALGERHVARQRQLAYELERDGHDTAIAKRLLAEFEGNQAMHIAHRDRLKRELAKLPRY